jgi:hypothetical protein
VASAGYKITVLIKKKTMKHLGQIHLNISKSQFIEKLKSVTIPVLIEELNQSNKERESNWFVNLIKQDYKAINKSYNVLWEQDVFVDSNRPSNTYFAGEVTENSVRIYVPKTNKDNSFDYKHIKAIDDKAQGLLKKLEEATIVAAEYSYDNYCGVTTDGERLFYYELIFDELNNIDVIKHKFKHEQDGRQWFNFLRLPRGCIGDITIPLYTGLILTLIYILGDSPNIGNLDFKSFTVLTMFTSVIFMLIGRILISIKYINYQRKIADEIFMHVIEKII